MSDQAITFDEVDGYGRLTFDQPGSRVNTLNQAVLSEFEKILPTLKEKTGLKGLLFCSGKPGMFIAGADLNELGAAVNDADQTKKLIQRGLDMVAGFEQLPYPTMVLIDGACVGGGLEVALGFDYRLAGSHPKVNIGLPEVSIGLIPGWGGTQRLPRIIGPALAAELICAGETVGAQRANELGIVFDVVPTDALFDEGKRILDWAKESGDWENQRQKKQRPVGVSEEQLSFTFAVAQGFILQKTKGQLPAPPAALEAIVKGCNLPLDQGLQIETEQFAPLVGSPISRNLIAVFFMDQRIRKDPGVEDKSIEPRTVNNVGVIGAGLMGSGIAGAHIRRGIPALMLDQDPKAVEKGVTANVKIMKSRIGIGRMTEEEMIASMSRLNTSNNLSLLADRDVVVEAVVENEKVKTDLFTQLRSVLGDNVILASNTSTISITRMARAWKKPENFAGMHFFNPVDRMKLVEVIRGEKTSDETVVTLVALAKKIGKSPIVVRDCPGFLVNRILFPYLNESLVMLEEGADPRDLDKAAVAFGMPMGPITLNDLVGLDTSLYAGQVIQSAYSDRTATSKILGELVKAGRLGKKTGAGFYNYAKGSRGADDPAFAEILAKCRTGDKTFLLEEITERLFLPMLGEASRVLMDDIVRAPSDVDMGLILGIGFPPQHGGILRWADTLGMENVLKTSAKYESLGERFQPTEQMRKLADAGKGFYGS